VTTLLLALDNDANGQEARRGRRKGQPLDPAEAQGLFAREILAAFYGQVATSATRKAGTPPSMPIDERHQAHA